MSIGAFGENFPYVNFHDLNLDWIIKTMKELNDKFDDAIASKITVANPLQWDITKQYEAYTIVMDNDIAYLSMQAVPYGIMIDNEEYWQVIFNLSDVFASIKNAISFSDDEDSTTSSVNRDVNSLVWLNDVLYVVTSAITMGDTYSSSNIEPVSIEVWVNNLVSDIKDELDAISDSISDIEDDIDDLDERTTSAREFILIGDSFGAGIDGDDNTHMVTGGGWIERFRSETQGWAKVYNNQTPLGGVYGFASSRPFLEVLQDAETHVPDKKKITDIVVLGGTNDIGISATTVKNAIQTFVNYVHTNYPHARLAIGCLGTNINKMINEVGPVYSSCLEYGAEYIADLRGLMCLCTYIGADGTHLKQSGYEFYQKYINSAILTGHSHWQFSESGVKYFLTVNEEYSRYHEAVRLTYLITENSYCMGICGDWDAGNAGIANMIPTDATATIQVRVCSQDVLKCFIEGERLQLVLAQDMLKVQELYMIANGQIWARRPNGMDSTWNGYASTGLKTIPY